MLVWIKRKLGRCRPALRVHHGIINQNWFDNPIDCDCVKGQDSCEQGDALVEVLDEKFYQVIKARDFFEG